MFRRAHSMDCRRRCRSTSRRRCGWGPAPRGAVLGSVEAVRQVSLPGEIARLCRAGGPVRASIGDTASAIRQLDRVLRALPDAVAVRRAEAARRRRSAGPSCCAPNWRARATQRTQQLRARQALTVWRHADVARSNDRALALAHVPRTIIRISGRGGRRLAHRADKQSAAEPDVPFDVGP